MKKEFTDVESALYFLSKEIEEKDKEIAELKECVNSWIKVYHKNISENQYLKQEIERLKEKLERFKVISNDCVNGYTDGRYCGNINYCLKCYKPKN